MNEIKVWIDGHNAEGKPIDPSMLSHNFARIVKRVGLKDVRFHDLRHTFASLVTPWS
jgi:integrase